MNGASVAWWSLTDHEYGAMHWCWERAAQLDPTYAAAFNNLAVAYEHEGQLAKARAAYEKALALEPNNALVRQNYDLFKEINDRAAQKDGRQL